MRIDSSGNLLVGRTTAGSGTGFEVNNAFGGYILSTSTGIAGVFDRLSTDGEIMQFRKDGTTVGSIGARGGDVYLETGNTGIRMYDQSDAIIPVGSTGVSRDAAIDFGISTIRFKDLYLSGGVYLGGTGAANLLDDYEEGAVTTFFAARNIMNLATLLTFINLSKFLVQRYIFALPLSL